MWSDQEVEILIFHFQNEPKPTAKIYAEIAKALGREIKVVRTWFANQRIRAKKSSRTALKSEPVDSKHFLPMMKPILYSSSPTLRSVVYNSSVYAPTVSPSQPTVCNNNFIQPCYIPSFSDLIPIGLDESIDYSYLTADQESYHPIWYNPTRPMWYSEDQDCVAEEKDSLCLLDIEAVEANPVYFNIYRSLFLDES